MSNEDWWSNLSPDEQDQLMMSQMGDTGGGFDFSYAPDEGSFGVQPDVSYFTTKGNVKPADLATEAKRVNLLQDYGSLSVDNILSGYAGGGAYDIGAFTPTYEFGAPLNTPGRRKAEALSKAGGWQGFVSDLILNQGMSPAEAENELYKTISAPDDASLAPADRAKKQSLMESLPPNMATGPMAPGDRVGGKAASGRAAYDTKQVTDFTTRVWGDLMSDPDVAYQDPRTGLAYAKTPEEALKKTPQMAAYDKFGIPYPTASYEDQKYIDALTEAEGGVSGDAYKQAADEWQAKQKPLERAAATAASEAQSAQTSVRNLQNEYNTAVGKQHPATEFSAMLDAFRAGGDQTAAVKDFRSRYRQGPGQVNLPAPAPTVGPGRAAPPGGILSTDLIGPTSAPQGFTYGTAAPPMTPGAAPWSTINSAGDRVIQRPGEPNAARSMFDFLRKGGFEKQQPSVLETLTPAMIEKQRGRAKATDTKAEQARQKAYLREYDSPEVAVAAALGRAAALARAGQTPYRDAMAARNANARRMLTG